MNHRVPIHTLLIKQFVMPLDIEMMTGRIQMVEMNGNFQQNLLKHYRLKSFQTQMKCQHMRKAITIINYLL